MGTRVWPEPDGGLYVAVENYEQERTTIGAYDRHGKLRAGWPIAIFPTYGCELRPVVDGSVRIVCDDRAFAFDVAGRPLPGWPVIVGDPSDVRVVKDELRVTTLTGVTTVARDGRVTQTATPTPAVSPPPTPAGQECGQQGTLGPDGTRFVVTGCVGSSVQTIDALDPTGERAGLRWPVSIPAALSAPVTGPGSRVYVVAVGEERSRSSILAFERDGRPVAGWSVVLPGSPPHVGSWAEGYIPMAPLVAADGTLRFVTDKTAYAIDLMGHVQPGWPYRSSVELGYVGYCGPCDIDCFPWPSSPLLASDNMLYLIGAPTETTGGQIAAIDPDGSVRPGWPVVLRRTASEFWSMTRAPDGTLFALAIELEGPAQAPTGACAPPASATVLAIDPDGSVRYRVTVVEP